MKRKSYSQMNCPIARSLEEIGEWWSILLLRDAFHGMTRFDEFETSLGIAPNMLTKRLATLVENGLMEKRPYSAKPLRHEYILTPKGTDFYSVLLTLVSWGNRHVFDKNEQPILLSDRESGEIFEPELYNPKTLKPINSRSVKIVAGPGATENTHERLAFRAKKTAERNAESNTGKQQ
ncbi:MAG: helix-turn-helix domain-containing protein [Micavibrio sp.]|nr:helix-turn-helix domain-containing protein [Micavibrio sp.]